MIMEEALSSTVRKYKVLYNRNHGQFHSKDVKKDAWKAVSMELGLKDGKFCFYCTQNLYLQDHVTIFKLWYDRVS